MATLAELEGFKPEIELLVQADYTAQSGNLGSHINDVLSSGITGFNMSTELRMDIDNWFNLDLDLPEGWSDLMKWIWKKIVDFFKWLFDL